MSIKSREGENVGRIQKTGLVCSGAKDKTVL